jgi:hypothetical protein
VSPKRRDLRHGGARITNKERSAGKLSEKDVAPFGRVILLHLNPGLTSGANIFRSSGGWRKKILYDCTRGRVSKRRDPFDSA